MPHLRKRLPTLRHLLMKPSLRTGRIANFSSSMPPLIDGLRRLTGFHVQRRHLWCRRERSSRPLSSQASARILTRLIMPNGRSIVLERQQGADVGGYSGLEDEVDNHWGELAKAALLSTVLSVGSEVDSSAALDRKSTRLNSSHGSISY